MNLTAQVAQLVLDLQARAELALLLAVFDLGGAGHITRVLEHVTHRQFLRDQCPHLESIAQDYLPQSCAVLRQSDYLILTRQGKNRLRNLCELAFAMRQRLKSFSSGAHVLIAYCRTELNIKPFSDQGVQSLPLIVEASDVRRDHHVYVILLHSNVLNGYRGQWINPEARRDMPCLYVGMTGFDPELRFKHHKMGRLSSREVQNHGLCLIPSLYSHLNPLSAAKAEETEKMLSVYLREQGFAVLAGHHDYEVMDRNRG